MSFERRIIYHMTSCYRFNLCIVLWEKFSFQTACNKCSFYHNSKCQFSFHHWKYVENRFFKLAGSTYLQPHCNIQLDDCISSRLVEVNIVKKSCSEMCLRNFRQATSLMTEGVYNWYFWNVKLFWEVTVCFDKCTFFKKAFLKYRYILLLYNTSVRYPFNGFSFLKSINHIVSVAESGYLLEPDWWFRE